MSSVNKVILLGYLGKDPEVMYYETGRVKGELWVGTSREVNGKSEMQWHRVAVWNKLAEACKRYLTKGSRVYVEGRLKYHPFQTSDGYTRYASEIIADKVIFLDKPVNQQ